MSSAEVRAEIPHHYMSHYFWCGPMARTICWFIVLATDVRADRAHIIILIRDHHHQQQQHHHIMAIPAPSVRSLSRDKKHIEEKQTDEKEEKRDAEAEAEAEWRAPLLRWNKHEQKKKEEYKAK
ncbi:hypothetical protein N9L68_04945 [bacterium]|nr:hypothetical protein [bacterium]